MPFGNRCNRIKKPVSSHENVSVLCVHFSKKIIDDFQQFFLRQLILNSISNSNFAHVFCLCTLKIQYLAVIQLSKFRCYAVWSCDFNNAGNVFINVSTKSLIFSSDSSVLSLSMVRNIWSSIWNACIHVMSDISSEKYKKSSPNERLSLDSRLSKESIIYRVKTTAVWVVIAS